MRGEFIQFLKQYGIIGLAIAVIIGGKANALVSSIVDGLIMPVILFALPAGEWRQWSFDIGKVHLVPGPAIGASIDFLIVAFIVFLFAKKVLKEEVVAKK